MACFIYGEEIVMAHLLMEPLLIGVRPWKALKGAYSGTTYIGDNSSNKVTEFALGGVNAYALVADSKVFSWGYGDNGSLGNNTNTSSITPVKVVGVGGIGDLTLPVELASFELIETRDQGITLQWVTESEINNLGFNLDRKDTNHRLEPDCQLCDSSCIARTRECFSPNHLYLYGYDRKRE